MKANVEIHTKTKTNTTPNKVAEPEENIKYLFIIFLLIYFFYLVVIENPKKKVELCHKKTPYIDLSPTLDDFSISYSLLNMDDCFNIPKKA